MKKLLAVIIIIPLLLMGCWDSVETEQLGVVRVIGLGMGENNDIRVIIQEIPHEKQTANSEGSSGGGKSSFHLYASSGSTVSEAIQKMSGNEHHELYFAHTKVIILDEELISSKGIMPVIDFCQRNPMIRLSTWILISPKNQFDKILAKDVGIGLDTGGLLEETIHNKMENSSIAIVNLGDFIELLNSSGNEAYTAGVRLTPRNSSNETTAISQSAKEKLYIADAAAFKGDKMVGWLIKEEYEGLSWIKGDVRRAIMNIPFREKTLSLRIVKVKPELKPELDKGKLKMNINVEVVSNIAETQANYDFMNEDTIREVERLQSEEIKSQITAAIEKSRRLDSDIFGIGYQFNIRYPELWKDIREDWYSYYSEVKVNINVDSTIKDIGNVYRTLE